MVSAEAAVAAIRARGTSTEGAARRRWEAAVDKDGEFDDWIEKFQSAGRLTLNFHPDRISRQGRSVASGLLADGWYRSRWVTGISSGSRSATPGGERQRFERQLFDGAYDKVSARPEELPIYGSLDLVFDDHGGSPGRPTRGRMIPGAREVPKQGATAASLQTSVKCSGLRVIRWITSITKRSRRPWAPTRCPARAPDTDEVL